MKVYSPNEISKLLKINPATLRKYSIMLEERGYKIERNSQNHRYYLDNDIITLRRIITGKNNGITIEKAIHNVINLEGDNAYTNDTNNAVIPYDSVMKRVENKIDNQNEMIHKQNELIGELLTRLDKQDEYINNSIKERDKLLLKAIDERLEAQKQIASTEEKEKKKGFFARLFKGGK